MVELTQQEQQALAESRLVWQMAQSEGYQTVFKPFLEAKLNQSFPDPSQFNKEEEFIYAAKIASVFKKVCAEILGWVESEVDQAKFLEKKEKGEVENNFEIGK